jgi:hypothetical protein
VEDALHAIGQMMASLGSVDQRLIAPRTLKYRLTQQLAGWRCLDPAPQCVTPASIPLIDYAYELAVLTSSPLQLAVVDMAYIAFFYLNRPSEYAQTTAPNSLSAPFCLCDVELSIGLRVFNASVASFDDICHATFASLIFTNQKNAVRGERLAMLALAIPLHAPCLPYLIVSFIFGSTMPPSLHPSI